jgi:hypothetical protein
MLHFLLLKMYPVAYKTRETYMLEEEKEIGCFSPKVDDLLRSSQTKEESNHLDDLAQSFTYGDGERSHNRSPGQVSIVDVSCATCKQLLFRPVVLNCGHVYCEACIVLAGEAIRCQVCQSPHPSGFPKVCLELDHFLEEQFPEEYTARRGTVQLKQVQFQHENSPTCSTKGGGFFHWLGENGPDVHIGVGCDSCGMMPIKGDRYRCIDCKEAIGFDLCGDCYNTPSKVPGRFNQQHTPDHRFEKEKSKTVRNIMLRLLRGESVDGLIAPLLSVDALENPENELPLVTPSTASDSEEPQNDDTQPAS